MKHIHVAKTAGFCFGVQRAIDMAEASTQNNQKIYALGKLIHNTHVCHKLAMQGMLTVETVEEIEPGASVLIRAHGVSKNTYQSLEDKDCTIIDASCPFVLKIHTIVYEANKNGQQVVVIGKKEHPEVIGICGWCENALVFDQENEIYDFFKKEEIRFEKPLCIVAQTTIERATFKKCVHIIKKLYTNIQIFDTICSATDERQTEAFSLAGQSDAMVVLGDPKSSNTQRLYDICTSLCENTVFAQDANELSDYLPQWKECNSIGVVAGASTPAWIIKEVIDMMSEETKFETESNESFAQMLEESFKTLHTGDKVTGIVTQISQTEIQVDLGVKQSGYIPIAELSDDPNYCVEDHIKVDEEIEVIVMRINDMEGTISLSKKRVDMQKGWDTIEKAKEDKVPVEGIIVEENRGGLVATSHGVRIFIPASQAGIPKGESLSKIMKKKVKFYITETNRQRKRVVGSIRAVTQESRRADAEQVWASIEVGKQYRGTVKSLTSYGAFVDIGGIDGMVHISEMSWNRIKHPSDVLSVGDEIDVFVLSLDTENKKISLSCKKAEDNPWVKFTSQYANNDIVKVKILKFMPFGAFAEIIPGVDGLIHISQISDHRIAKPDEVLTVGQEVDALIIDIEPEKKKISLSIRALSEENETEECCVPVDEYNAAAE